MRNNKRQSGSTICAGGKLPVADSFPRSFRRKSPLSYEEQCVAQTSANVLTPLYETCLRNRFVAAAYVSPRFETLSINFG